MNGLIEPIYTEPINSIYKYNWWHLFYEPPALKHVTFRLFVVTNSLRNSANVEAVEAKIRAEVWKKQIRMKTFFEDYDKLRKGTCI